MTTTRRLALPNLAQATRAPVTKTELEKATRALRKEARGDAAATTTTQTVARPALKQQDVRALRDLCAQYGAVHDLDVHALATKMGEQAAGNLTALYSAVKKLKASGEITAAMRAETVTDAVLMKLGRGDLTPRVARHVAKVARLELFKLFSDPVKDKELHRVLAGELKKDFRVDAKSLRERNARMQNGLVALLFEKGLSPALKKLALEKLALCAGEAVIPTLQSFARKEPALRDVTKATIESIQKASKQTIVFASMEVAPYAFAGGLGNVMAELPKSLAKMGHRVIVLTPRHTIIDRDKLEDSGKRITVHHPDGTEPANLLKDVVDGVEHYFIENAKYYSDHRHGLYGDQFGSYGDVGERYDFFSMSIPQAIKAILGEQAPDIVQLNDAHTGPAAAYIRNDPAFAQTKTVMAIHNLGGAYQGKLDKAKLDHMGFKDLGLFYPAGPAEFYDQINFLKLGLVMSDASIAVSREYMKEILEQKNGEGLEGVLRSLHAEDRLWGNLNGIDTTSWDPAADQALPATYSFADRTGKATCKADLQKTYGLPQSADTPVIGVCSRITDQKGIDDIVATIERRMGRGEDVQFVVCGQGDAPLIAQLQDLAARYPQNVAFDGAFTKAKERRIIGGSDMFLMPSRFEPCGLPQMYAMRYLTVPIVRAVGGLEESVAAWDPDEKTGTGFKFDDDIETAMDAALSWFRSGAHDRDALIRNCALTDFSWDASSAVEQAAFFRQVRNA